MNILDEDEDDDMDMSNKNVVEDMREQHKPRLLSDIKEMCAKVRPCGHPTCKTCTVTQYAKDKIMSTCTGRTYDIQYNVQKNISEQKRKMIENNKQNAIKRKEQHTRMSEQDKYFEINDFRRKQKSLNEKMKNINHRLDCKSDWIVYLATCACCGVQYVGSTIQELHVRCNTRRHKMKNASEQTENELFTDIIRHYTQENSKCKMESIRIQPVEQIYLSDYDPEDDYNLAKERATAELRAREDFWIKTLWTLQPWGLNYKLNADYNKNNKPVAKMFHKLKRRYGDNGSRGQGVEKNDFELNFKPDFFFKHLVSLKQTMMWRNECRKAMNRLQNTQMSALMIWLEWEGKEMYAEEHDLIMICEDITHHKTNKTPLQITTKEKRKCPVRWHVKFVSKGIQRLDLEGMLHDERLQGQSFFVENVQVPMIVYSHKTPIRNTILNYNKVQKSIKGDMWNKDYEYSCLCHESKFCNKELGHIQTGDLNLITHENFRRLCRMGVNYVDPSKEDGEETEEAATAGLCDMISQWSKAENKDDNCWLGWLDMITTMIHKKVNNLETTPVKQYESYLSDPDLLQAMAKLHEKYVFTTTDKVNTNVSIICKEYYIRKQVEELAYNEANTFERVMESEKDVIERLTKVLKDDFGITPQHPRLATMYETSKNHKTPPAIRFITAASKCIHMEIAERVDLALEAVIQQLREKCTALHKKTGVRHMWFMDDVTPLLKYIRSMSGMKNARNVRVDDFPKMYNGIEHDDLLQKLEMCIADAFDEANCKYISIYKNGARFVNEPQKKTTALTMQDLMKHLRFMVENALVMCGDRIYRQRIGIPMGMRPSPRIANLYLHCKEYAFIVRMLIKAQLIIHKYFAAVFRYQDDGIAGNNDNKMDEYKHDIYGDMIPIKQNTSDTEANYMNVTVSVQDGQYRIKSYDKKRDFESKPIQFTHISSDTPDKAKHGIIKGQMITYTRTCDRYADFLKRVQCDVNVMVDDNELYPKVINKNINKYIKTNNEYERYLMPKYKIKKDLNNITGN